MKRGKRILISLEIAGSMVPSLNATLKTETREKSETPTFHIRVLPISSYLLLETLAKRR